MADPVIPPKATESATEPVPPVPAKRLLTSESLKARGWKELKPSGKGFGLPTQPPPAPAKRLPTSDELKARGWRVAEPGGRGFFLPLHGPRPKQD
jgi:hypothetical protein